MKYVINNITTVLFGYPALIAGYLWRQIYIGFDLGIHVYDQHEQACMERFSNRKKGKT